MEHLNSDLLRTFHAVARTGSVTEGAARIFRSQSAASLQIKKLEDLLGQPVFERHGRGVILTEAGERLLPVAKEVMGILDATLRDLTADDLNGKIRFGIPDDESKETLSSIIGAFAQSHPRVELEVTCALSTGFPAALSNGSLDLAVYELAQPPTGMEVLRRERTCWMMSRHVDLLSQETIPVALFDRDCWWRDSALAGLKASGRRYRVVYSSQSAAGVAAAIGAGIAIGVMGERSLAPDLKRLGPAEGFGNLPISCLVLTRGEGADNPAIRALETAVRQAFAAEIRAETRAGG